MPVPGFLKEHLHVLRTLRSILSCRCLEREKRVIQMLEKLKAVNAADERAEEKNAGKEQ